MKHSEQIKYEARRFANAYVSAVRVGFWLVVAPFFALGAVSGFMIGRLL